MNLHPAFADAFARALADAGVSLGELSRHLTLVVTALTEIPRFCSSKFPTLGRSAA